jgi:proteasome lid subunit RPN8/RPN11
MESATGNAIFFPDRCAGVAIGTIHERAYRILIAESVLEEILDYSERDVQREAGGFLIGAGCTTPRRQVEVRYFLPAIEARSRFASLMFTHDTWAAMTREVQRQYPDHSVLGWHHTHPGFGVFLSAYDVFIQRHFFSEPWQIALVVDPQRRELGFFQWLDGRVVDCGFVCTKDAVGAESQAE